MGEFKAGVTNQLIFQTFKRHRNELHVSITWPHSLHVYTSLGVSKETKEYHQLISTYQSQQRIKCQIT